MGVSSWSIATGSLLEPVFPARKELEEPQAPVANEAVHGTFAVYEISIVDGRSEGFVELLLSFEVPSFEESFVVDLPAGGTGDGETPGQGDGISESGRDALSSD